MTEVDRESEALIVSAIRHAFPNHAILAEEGGGIERTSPFLWLIDPLDGTNNYAHGFPFFAVSIALMEDGELRLGVVFDPLRDELFFAERGAGAWRNDQRLHVSDTPALAASLVSTGFPTISQRQQTTMLASSPEYRHARRECAAPVPPRSTWHMWHRVGLMRTGNYA